MSTKVSEALVWIKSILDKLEAPYQVVGGLAANIHGGKRPVADIDMYIPPHAALDIVAATTKYLVKPLKHYREGVWDLDYFQLNFNGQKIELGLSPGTKIYNKATDEWIEIWTDYCSSVLLKYEGIEVPVIPVDELVAYKAILNREVDVIDISEVTMGLGH